MNLEELKDWIVDKFARGSVYCVSKKKYLEGVHYDEYGRIIFTLGDDWEEVSVRERTIFEFHPINRGYSMTYKDSSGKKNNLAFIMR